MKKNFKFIMLAAAAIAMIGCAKDGDKVSGPNAKGEQVTASFRIALPSGSRAYTDVPGTVAESKITTAKVYLFDNSNRLETIATLTPDGTGETASNNNVITTSGAHTIFVLVNTPATAFTSLQVTTDSQNGTALADFKAELIAAMGATNLAAITTANNFFMTGEKSVTFVVPTVAGVMPAANNVQMPVERAVAKVSMTINAALEQPADGTVGAAGIAYATMNNSVNMYAVKNYSGSNLITPLYTDNGVTRTNYFRWPVAGAAVDYKAPATGIYIVENAHQAPNSHNQASLLIKGQYTPHANNAAGKPAGYKNIMDADGSATTYTAGTTFYRVWDKSLGKWIGGVFTASPSATGIIVANGGNIVTDKAFVSLVKYGADPLNLAGDPEYYIIDYINGWSYWRLPLGNKEKPAANKYEVERNDWFRVDLLSISDLGAARDDDGGDGVLPKDPDPLNIPVAISCSITVAPWRGIDMEGNI